MQNIFLKYWIWLYLEVSQSSLTLSWRRPLSYRTQSIDLRSKSMDWSLYDNGLRHERVKQWFTILKIYLKMYSSPWVNPHHDVTNLEIKEWLVMKKIGHSRNRTWFYRQKKISQIAIEQATFSEVINFQGR